MASSPYDLSRSARRPLSPPAVETPKKPPAPVWKGIVGKSFTVDGFHEYCSGLAWTTWRPSFVVLHNTGVPTLANRPDGLTASHIQNLVTYYRDTQKWSAGPHLFVDDQQIWVFTPLTVPGVHSPSYNNTAIGLEMLGDFDTEAFDSGRGLQVRCNAVAAMATLSMTSGLDPFEMLLHREDPKTTHACPGTNVVKGDVINLVIEEIIARNPGDHIMPDFDE